MLPYQLFKMYRLRTGLNQQELAEALNLNSRRMVQYWEAGNGIPKAENLKKLIGLFFQQGVFRAGEEQREVSELWNIVKDYYEARSDRYEFYPIFDEGWFEDLLTVRQKAASSTNPMVRVLAKAEFENSAGKISEQTAESKEVLTEGERAASEGVDSWPVELTSFVGREKELGEIQQLLRANRLVTITGTGGTGKTRLALKVAEGLAADFEGHTFFVNLANLTDPALVASTTAQVLGLPESPETSPAQAVRNYLKDKKFLLVLDNFEQLTGATSLLGDWLTNSPRLKLLVTSRVVLNLYGEQHYQLSPLPLPTGAAAHWDVLQNNPAVSLFVERARLYRPDFNLTKTNSPAILQICTLLDGLPLALELAAARIKFLSPQKLLEKLTQHRLKLPGEPPHNLARRHQTLYETLDWSYALLNPSAQLLFRRLAVFSRSWTLEEVETVCSGRGLATAEIAELVGRLINHSLLTLDSQAEDDEEELHYCLLETIREYALEKLLESGETSVWENAAARFSEPGDQFRYSNFGKARLHYNAALRAVGYLPENLGKLRRQIDLLVKYISVSFAVVDRPQTISQLEKAITELEKLSAAENLPDDQLRLGWLHYWAGYLLYLLEGSPEADFPHWQTALAIGEKLNQVEFVAVVKMTIGRFLVVKGYYQKAAPYFQETALSLEKSDNRTARINANLSWAQVLVALGHYQESVSVIEEALVETRQANNLSRTGYALSCLATTFARARNWQKVLEIANEGISVVHQSGEAYSLLLLLYSKGLAAASLGLEPEARETLSEMLSVVRSGNFNISGHVYGLAAAIATLLGEVEQGLQLAQEAVALSKKISGMEALGLGHRAWARALNKKENVPPSEVEAHLREALAAFEEGGVVIELANTTQDLAEFYQSLDDNEAAALNYRQALSMFENFGVAERVDELKLKLKNLR